MEDLIKTVRDLATQHGIKFLTAAAFTGVGWLIGRWRAAQSWKKREFFNRLNVSLNSLQDGKLLIRTVLEKTCEEILLNSVAVERLIKAAQQTTKNNPLIPGPKEVRWFYLNDVLNEFSITFAAGLFRREAARCTWQHTLPRDSTRRSKPSISTAGAGKTQAGGAHCCDQENHHHPQHHGSHRPALAGVSDRLTKHGGLVITHQPTERHRRTETTGYPSCGCVPTVLNANLAALRFASRGHSTQSTVPIQHTIEH